MRIRKPLHYIAVCILTALGLNLFAMLLPPSPSIPVGPSMALAQTAKQKARAAYRKQAKKLARANTSSGRRYARYRFADVYGGSGEEMLVVTPADGGSGSYLRIYTYKAGKLKLLLKEGLYGDVWYHFYKKSGAFTLYRVGHGGKGYFYYKASGGKYKLVLMKTSYMEGYDGTYSSWSYYDRRSGEYIGSSAFSQRVKAIAKGACKKVAASWKWSYMAA